MMSISTVTLRLVTPPLMILVMVPGGSLRVVSMILVNLTVISMHAAIRFTDNILMTQFTIVKHRMIWTVTLSAYVIPPTPEVAILVIILR